MGVLAPHVNAIRALPCPRYPSLLCFVLCFCVVLCVDPRSRACMATSRVIELVPEKLLAFRKSLPLQDTTLTPTQAVARARAASGAPADDGAPGDDGA